MWDLLCLSGREVQGGGRCRALLCEGGAGWCSVREGSLHFCPGRGGDATRAFVDMRKSSPSASSLPPASMRYRCGTRARAARMPMLTTPLPAHVCSTCAVRA